MTPSQLYPPGDYRRGGAGRRNPNVPAMVADRAAGMKYADIGKRYGISRITAMRHCRRELGLETA